MPAKRQAGGSGVQVQPRTWREGRGKKRERKGNVAGTKAVLGNKTCTHMSCKTMNIDI